jgi:anthrone oxygenase-like protein
MGAVLQLVATLAAGLFAGAAVYISFVEHPARMQCGTRLAVTEFSPSYKRATWMQAPLAAVGSLSGIAAWLLGAHGLWAIGGILLGAIIPLTLIVIVPTNKRLLDPGLDKDSDHAKRLLVRWGRLHCLRTLLSIVALLIFLILKSH